MKARVPGLLRSLWVAAGHSDVEELRQSGFEYSAFANFFSYSNEWMMVQ